MMLWSPGRPVLALSLLALALPALAAAAPAAEPAEAAPTWGYAGPVGPPYWSQLDDRYALCSGGREQSPVDLTTAAAPAAQPALQFLYRPVPLRIQNNGHTVQVHYDPGSFLVIGSQRFELEQFHFHTPSEHAFVGGTMAMEIHLVHRSNQEGAVVAVLVVPGPENQALAPVWPHLPRVEGPVQVIPGVQVDARGLIPARPATYRYDGSLTTPPCDEGVRFLVFEAPITLSPAQIAAFQAIFPANSRPLQPLNGRPVHRVP